MNKKNILLNPRKDYIFKAMFTQNTENSRGALKSFLSAVLDKKVSNVHLQQNELAADYVGDRQTSFDVLCFIDDDTPVNIELQAAGDFSTFAKRIEYHSAHLLNYYVRKGSSFENVPVTYQISVVDFIFDKSTPEYVSHYLMQTDTQRKLTARQNIIVIELPKVRKLKFIPPENLTILQKWCKFFVDNDKKTRQQYLAQIAEAEEGIMQAQMTLAELGRNYTQWSAEEARFNAMLELNTKMARAEKKGERRGRKEGVAYGLQQGEHKKAIETARALFSLGVNTIEQIAQATGLPLAEVQQLQQLVTKK